MPKTFMYIRTLFTSLRRIFLTIPTFEMYSIHSYTRVIAFIILALSSPSTYAQSAADRLIVADTSDIFFEKIRLDDAIAYRNESTGEIIDQQEYTLLCEGDLPADGSDHEGHNHYDYWQCDQINPYKDFILPSPFLIAFDQQTFTHPVDGDIVVTSRFGRRRRGPHRGLDLDLVTGDNVRSVLPGKIRFVGYSRGHGKTVVVRHANDVETVYAHLSAYTVKVNDVITEGQIIGLGGNTGNSRGSHLHLEVRYKGVCIHPEYVFNFDGSQTIRNKELWVTNGWKSPTMHSSYKQSQISPLTSEADAIAYQSTEPKYHKVKRGDTLSEIARSYSLRLSEICSMNAISRSSILRIGQVIQIR